MARNPHYMRGKRQWDRVVMVGTQFLLLGLGLVGYNIPFDRVFLLLSPVRL